VCVYIYVCVCDICVCTCVCVCACACVRVRVLQDAAVNLQGRQRMYLRRMSVCLCPTGLCVSCDVPYMVGRASRVVGKNGSSYTRKQERTHSKSGSRSGPKSHPSTPPAFLQQSQLMQIISKFGLTDADTQVWGCGGDPVRFANNMWKCF